MNEQQAIAKPDSAPTAPAMRPPVDIIEDETGISLAADLPGVSRDKLTVRMEGQSLLIEGDVVMETPAEMEPDYVEIHSPLYRRRFHLSRDLDPSGIEATLHEGVLNVRIPKAEHAQPRRISVTAG